jgi:hypothetical protein
MKGFIKHYYATVSEEAVLPLECMRCSYNKICALNVSVHTFSSNTIIYRKTFCDGNFAELSDESSSMAL